MSRVATLSLVAIILGPFLSPEVAAQPPKKPTVSLTDTVTFRTIESVRMAADGHAVAYVVRDPDLQNNNNPNSLFVIDLNNGNERVLATGDTITSVSWAPDNRFLYALVRQGSRYLVVRADVLSGQVAQLVSSDTKINSFAVAPNGLVGAFTTAAIEPEKALRLKEEGVVYDPQRHTGRWIVERNYDDGEGEDIHLIDLSAKTSRVLLRIPYTGPGRNLPFILEMSFSPNGQMLALVLFHSGDPAKGGRAFNTDIGIVDIDEAKFTQLLPGSMLGERAVAWSADSRRMLFDQSSKITLYDLPTGTFDQPAWAVVPEPVTFSSELVYDSVGQAAYARTQHGVYKIDYRRNRVTKEAAIPDASGQASYDRAFRSYAYVEETSERRPEVAVYDSETKNVRRLTNLNSWVDERALGKIEKVEVVNSSSAKVTGYLVHPVDYEVGKTYPLIVGTYGFSGKFILQAEWHTTFPAQALAGAGYAVLLLNVPKLGQNVANDPVKARDLEGWQMLSTFEHAVDDMVKRGIADPERVGLYGWSHGGFVVEFLLAHSRKHFKAASFGEGGDYNPSGCWIFGTTRWVQICKNLFDGPLTAKTMQAYAHFSPVMSIDRFDAPLLMEFSGRYGFIGLETYMPLHAAGKPAELVIYDDEEHNFVRPRARLASMGRKVDWFNFWMLGKEDPSPIKTDQYMRWRAMRDANGSAKSN